MNLNKKNRFYPIILSFVLLTSLFYFSACALIGSPGKPHAVQSNGGYRTALEKSTRKADIYNHLNTVMYIRATYLNKRFVYAYTKAYAKYYILGPKSFREKLNKLNSLSAKFITLFVSVYMPKKSYNNLGAKQSIWMVYLTNNEGESVMPVSIKHSQQKIAFSKKFFPYITAWSKQYVIKFPVYYDKTENKLFINPSTKWIKLVITGVNGKAVLKWNL